MRRNKSHKSQEKLNEKEMSQSKKPFNTYSLKFQNQDLELEYVRSRKKSQEKIYLWYSRISFGLVSLLAGYRIIFIKSRQMSPEIIRLALNGVFLLVPILLRRMATRINITPALICGLYLTDFISELESTKESMNENDWSNSLTYVGAFQIGSLQYLASIFNIHWFESWFLFIILQVYVFIRFSLDSSSFIQETFQSFGWCIAIIILSGLLAYLQELSYRWIYHESLKRKQYFQFFHDLFKNNIPNSIIIAKSQGIDEDSVIFANKASENLLGTEEKSEMLEKLNEFSFNRLDHNKENSKRCPSEEAFLNGDQLRFWNILREKGLKENAGSEFKEYQAVIENKLENYFSDPLNKVKVGQSKIVVDESFKLRPLNPLRKQSKSFNSNRVLPLRSESIDSGSSSASDEEQMFAFSMKKTSEKLKEIRFFSVKIGKIDWEDTSNATLFIFQEVTDSVSEANHKAGLILARNKNRLLASVSHQMRTPLNAIISSIDTLLPKFEHDKASNKLIKLCWRSAQLLYYSMGNIIDLSKISSRTFSPEISMTPAVPLIEYVLKLIRFKAKLKEITLECSYNQLQSYLLLCDQERLKQILLNLIENSIKYTDPGGRITFTVTIEGAQHLRKSLNILNSEDIRCDEGGGPAREISADNIKQFAKFTLEDSGQGIEGYRLPTLFKLFGEIEEGKHSEISEGVGLGLALSQYLLKKMLPKKIAKEGLIKVQSNKGKGSTFSFMIPVEMMRKTRKSQSSIAFFPRPSLENHLIVTNSSEKSEKPTEEVHDNNEDRRSGLRALVVDDDQINQLVVKNYLIKLGVTKHEVANDGKEAVELVIKFASMGSPFNLVLMDCNMPIMNGYEATARIREQEQAGLIPPLKIIAITANVATNDWDRCREAGMNSYLTKPINKTLFRETLERHLGIKFLEV